MKRIRRYFVRRRIDRIMREISWPTNARSIFSGNVTVRATKYADVGMLAKLVSEASSEFPAVDTRR